MNNIRRIKDCDDETYSVSRHVPVSHLSPERLNSNTNPVLLSCQPGQMFSLWPAQKLSVFVSRFVHSSGVRGRPGLRAKLSRQVQTFNSHPSVMKTHRGEGGGHRRRLHRRLVITLSKDLLSICWCARERVLTPCDWITGVARGALERGQAWPEAHGHAEDQWPYSSCVTEYVALLQLLTF